jgi:hypothetical protein
MSGEEAERYNREGESTEKLELEGVKGRGRWVMEKAIGND